MTLNLLLKGPLYGIELDCDRMNDIDTVKTCVQLTFLYCNKSLCQCHELFFVVFPEVPEPGKAPLLQIPW